MKSLLAAKCTSTDNEKCDGKWGDSGILSVENQRAPVFLHNAGGDDDVQQQPFQEIRQDNSSADCLSHGDENSDQPKILTNADRANLVLKQGLVQYHLDSKAFTVLALDQQIVHAVHMSDPKRIFRCSCPSKLQSYSHILAANYFSVSYYLRD